ncbi:opioid-binding protein/cell adhesion molecule precursor, partial [Silurus asotus]
MGLCAYVVVPWRCLAVLALRLLFLVPAGVPARSGDSYLKDNITVRQGDSAVLNCNLMSFTRIAFIIVWELHSESLFTGFAIWQQDVSSRSFKSYVINVNLIKAFVFIKTFFTFFCVSVPARIVNISTDITVNEGSNVSLMCLAIGRPEPSIIWKYRSARGRRFVSEGEYVEMTAITKEQSGSYECISSNDISPADVRTVQVTVNYPPVISQARSTGTAVGQRGVLQCEASAVPLADFQWYKEERRLFNGLNGVKIENKGKQSMLIFFNVSEEDYGNYTCVAMNTLGITNASIILYGPGAIHDVNSAALSPSSSVCPWLTLILFYLRF